MLLTPDGKELFRYPGKHNSDRLSPKAPAAKITEFRKPCITGQMRGLLLESRLEAVS